MWGKFHLLAVMLLTYLNWEIPLAVDLNQIRTMTSETIDPIDWPLPPPYTGPYALDANASRGYDANAAVIYIFHTCCSE